jgi:hypothetical protein
LASIDTALISKAYNFEELAPEAKKFQEALKSGNTELAE